MSLAQINKILQANQVCKTVISLPVNDTETVQFDVIPSLPVTKRAAIVAVTRDMCLEDYSDLFPYIVRPVLNTVVMQSYCGFSEDVDIDAVNALLSIDDVADKVFGAIVDDIDQMEIDVINAVEYVQKNNMSTNQFNEVCVALTDLVNGLSEMVDSVARDMSAGEQGMALTDIVDAMKVIGRKDDKAIVNAVLDYQHAKKSKNLKLQDAFPKK